MLLDVWGFIIVGAIGALVPTFANGVWEYYLAKGTRNYVDSRVATSEAKAQKDRDTIFSEVRATKANLDSLIGALQEPVAPSPTSPGFAHGAVDPAEAVEAREVKKRERKERQLQNAAAIAEALGDKAAFAKQIVASMGLDYKDLLDSENTAYVVGLVKKFVGGGKMNGNGHSSNPLVEWR